MSDETKIEQEKECFCKSKGFRKFFVIALGTFVGGYCALSLFFALHKPPIMHHHHPMGHMHHAEAPAPMGHHGGFRGPENFKGDFQGAPQGQQLPPKELKENSLPLKQNPQK